MRSALPTTHASNKPIQTSFACLPSPSLFSQVTLTPNPVPLPAHERLRTTSNFEEHNRLTEARLVHRIRHHVRVHVLHHILTTLRIQRPQVNVRRIGNIHHVLLTALAAQTGRGTPVLVDPMFARSCRLRSC